MLERLQRFGAAMFVPVLLFPFVGIFLSIIIVLQNPVLVGDFANPNGLPYKILTVLAEGGWTVFRNMPLIFAVGIPISLASKAPGRAVLAVLVSYLTFNYYLSAILAIWGNSFGVDFSQDIGGISGLTMIAGIKTLDTSIIGGILISALVVSVHNRYFDKKLPDYLGIFQGTSFVVIVSFFLLIPVAFLTAFIWPIIQQGILNLQVVMINTGFIGVWIYTFLERILIPTGLHHFIYGPFIFGPAVMEGGIARAWFENLPVFSASSAAMMDLFPAGAFSLHGNAKVFGLPGAALAIYYTAKPENRKMLLSLLIPATLTSVFAGITEPIEFTFLFIAPMLFLLHALLAATLATTLYLFGVVAEMGGGVIGFILSVWIPLFKNHSSMVFTNIGIGLIFTGIYFVIFRYVILKYNIPTPGRTENDAQLFTKDDYKKKKVQDKTSYAKKAIDFMELLGGRENIKTVANCATRLRIAVIDETKVKNEADFKKAGALGLAKNGVSIQIIIGLDVPNVRDEFEKILHT